MSGVRQKIIIEAEEGMRLDRWFHQHFPDLSHGQLQKLLRKGQVRVNGGRCKGSRRLRTGEQVRIPPLPDRSPRKPVHRADLSRADRDFIRSLVLYRDDDFIAINKPCGLAVQGGTGQGRHVDGLLEGLKFEADERPRLVHRLDRDTSGVLMLARSRAAASLMSKRLKARESCKLYWALVKGVPRPGKGQIELALAKRKGRAGEKMQVCYEGEADAQYALSRYEVLASAAQQFSFVALTPLTGRTHQLRVHMNEIGFPIIGDGKYGGAKAHPGGEVSRKLHLHARSFSFVSPSKRKRVTIWAPLGEHMAQSFDLMGFDQTNKDNPFLLDDEKRR